MSQAGIVDFEGSHPQVPTSFVTNNGTAVPIGNVLEVLGTTVIQQGIPLETTGSGNTVTIVAQYAAANASSSATKAGLASFNSAYFSVDANGYVTLSGASVVESFMVDAFTSPGTNPVAPNVSGIVTITGGQIAAGTTTNVIRTNSLSANTYTIQIQRSQAVASSTVGDNGVSHFNSTYFTVDSNGFVSLNGSGVAETITGNTGGALPPTSGNWNILGSGSITTSGSGSTLTIELTGLTNHAVQVGGVGTTLTQVGPSATVGAVLTSNGSSSDPSFQTISSIGAITTITGNSGGAEVPSAGNFNILGTGSITVVGSTNTETIELTGLTNHNVLVGAGTATITNVSPSATSGVPLVSNGSSSDPSFGTAVVAGGGTGAITLTAHGVLLGQGTSAVTATAVGTTGTVLSGNTGADPTFQTISSLGGITTITGNTGGAESPLSGNFNILGTGSITVAGSANTETVQLTGLTNHNVLIGAGTATITNVAPSATSGVPLISGGSSADPSFGTAVVAGGGTGNTTFTAYSVICAGTTATGAFQNVSGVGTSGQVLTSNGASALPTWQAASTGNAFTSIVVQVFLSNGTYTPTSGMTYCTIEVCGGGGAGGGAAATSSTQGAAGGGGGGGGYARKTVSAATIGASQTVTVGAGGTIGAAGNNAGNAGGTSSVGSIVSATGGNGGGGSAVSGTTNAAVGARGLGGGGASGDFNSAGNSGTFGFASGVTPTLAFPGTGGGSYFGGGNASTASGTNSTNSGASGAVYGGGGGGGYNLLSQASGQTGAPGGQGIVIITEYIG